MSYRIRYEMSHTKLKGAYGLPTAVIQLLNQLTPHSDALKWQVSGGNGKVMLTLTWDWRTSKKTSIWEKVQRTLKISKDPSPSPTSFDLSPYRPKRSKSFRTAQRNGYSSLNGGFSPSQSPAKKTSTPTSTPVKLENPISPVKRSDSHLNKPVKISYRTEEDVQKSLEDLHDAVRVKTRQELEEMRQEWNKSMRNSLLPVCDDNDSDSSDSSSCQIRIDGAAMHSYLDACERILTSGETLII
ncbi:unnamed protein product [Dimorphilus gyrociliatus]|uniref:Uncharacterized protein n=1 Tax=Dimorphilus gyrociliatus TaxID=2664684 RepID=A0A7I8VA35_9ANNE|nr:unnamed protein product [Dimorphilus gyrociliatus]